MDAGKKAWAWVPPLYFIEGLPNAVITGLAVLFYSGMGLSDGHAVALTGSLGLPWVLKPLWSPLVDSAGTKRGWIFSMLAGFVLCFALLALAPFFSEWVLLSLAAFWILGFASATYDISADGFYMIALGEGRQAFFVGIRNTCYRLAVVFAKGALVVMAGLVAGDGPPALGWSCAFGVCAVLCGLAFAVFFVVLSRPAADAERRPAGLGAFFSEFAGCFSGFFRKPFIISILAYVCLYRFAEAQLANNLPLFLMADPSAGGLSLTLAQNGLVNGTAGVVCLLAGGILGGVLISRFGLLRCILPMAFAINLPNLLYVLLAWARPRSLALVSACVGLEQFGYGLGFASYMMFLMHASRGAHKTSHYAIATGFMALGLMLPATFSGYIQESLGFLNFFWWVALCTLVSFAVTVNARRALAAGL